jgi:hypothetical protein
LIEKPVRRLRDWLSGCAGGGICGRLKQRSGTGFEEQFGRELTECDRADFGAKRLVMDADRFARGWVGDYRKNLLPFSGFVLRSEATVNADGNLAASPERGKSSAFGGDGEARSGIVQEGDSGYGCCVILTCLDAK